EYPVAYDIEDSSQKSLSKDLRTEIAATWLQKVEDEGYYVMLYASASWLGSKFNMDDLKSYDVWCAAYVSSQSNISKYYKGNYGIWQYSSSITLSDVYKSKLDHNYAFKDYAKIITSKHLNNL
ncbi:MAG: hypothetical protein LUE31_03430, partial [Lachnospiraceae bacterium]|nr:hypothetical protein [Lachnospiraceae bacterium]